MDQDTKFAILVLGIPLIGLAYCGIIVIAMIYSPWLRSHPIISASIFALVPSLVSGSIWLYRSFQARKQERLGL